MRLRPRSRLAAVLFVSASLLAVSACSSSSTSSEGSGDASTVRIALASDPSSLDPQAVQDGNALAVYGNVAEPLVFRDATSDELHPGLALSWSSVNDKTWRFKLRQGVKFSDGEPFNADAVVFSINRITNPDFSTEQSWVGPINGAKKVDEFTVDITTKVPDPQVPARLSAIMMVPPEAAKKPDFATKPVGTGPYTVVDWAKGAQAELKANPDYWGGAPGIDKVIFKPIKEPTVRMSALKTGEVDLVPGLLPEQIDSAPASEKIRGPEFPAVILDTRGGPFKDPKVRQAANYAVDKETLLKQLYAGLGSVANCQMMGEDVFGYNPDLEPYAYDPEKAKQLLAEAGQPHPSVTLVGDSSNRWLKDVELEQGIAGYLEKVGFTVKLQLADFSTYLSELFPKSNSATVERPDMIFFSRSNTIPDADETFTGWYTSTGVGSSTSDPELDRLVNQGRSELDASKRAEIYKRVNEIGCKQADFIFLMNLDDVYGMTDRLDWNARIDGQILVKTMKLAG